MFEGLLRQATLEVQNTKLMGMCSQLSNKLKVAEQKAEYFEQLYIHEKQKRSELEEVTQARKIIKDYEDK